ncbi:MAG: hypothetical protein ACLP1Y_06055 [Candidatus Acidiferrales bacterium]
MLNPAVARVLFLVLVNLGGAAITIVALLLLLFVGFVVSQLVEGQGQLHQVDETAVVPAGFLLFVEFALAALGAAVSPLILWVVVRRIGPLDLIGVFVVLGIALVGSVVWLKRGGGDEEVFGLLVGAGSMLLCLALWREGERTYDEIGRLLGAIVSDDGALVGLLTVYVVPAGLAVFSYWLFERRQRTRSGKEAERMQNAIYRELREEKWGLERRLRDVHDRQRWVLKQQREEGVRKREG